MSKFDSTTGIFSVCTANINWLRDCIVAVMGSEILSRYHLVVDNNTN
jgi:hypothetical protein